VPPAHPRKDNQADCPLKPIALYDSLLNMPDYRWHMCHGTWGEQRVQNRWTILAVLTAVRLAMGFQFQAIGTTSPFLIEELGIDFATIGFLIGLYLLPGIVLAFPGGMLGQRFGDKKIVVIGLLLMALGGFVTGSGGTYEAVVAGRALSGIGAVLLNVLLTKMLTDWFAERELVLAMSVFVNSWPTGIGLALITLGPLAENVSWQAAFYATSLVCAVSLAPIILFYQAPGSQKGAPRQPTSFTRLSPAEMALAGLAGTIWALYNAAYAILLGFTPSFLLASGYSVAGAGFMLGLHTWVFVVSCLVGGFLVQRFGRTNALMVIGFVGFGVCLVMLPLVAYPTLILVTMAALSGPPAGVIIALPAEVIKPENRATGFGFFITWYYVGMATLPALAGWLYDISGNPGAPFYFGGGLMVVCLFTLLAFKYLQHKWRIH
jgi:MFS family permease